LPAAGAKLALWRHGSGPGESDVMTDRERWLVRTMLELTDSSDLSVDDAAYAGLLCTRIAELLAPAEAGLLLVDDAGDLGLAAASTERAEAVTLAQLLAREGPAFDAHMTGRPVVGASLTAADRRWPRFAAAARASGVIMVSAFPLRREQPLGVICVAVEEERLDAGDVELAQALVSAAAIAMAQRRELRHSTTVAAQLQRALDSRVLIEQAKGVVAARLGMTPEAAFTVLRGYARHTSQPLADVASKTISGELTAPDLIAAPGPRRTGSRA